MQTDQYEAQGSHAMQTSPNAFKMPKFSGIPYRAEIHEELNFAAKCRRMGLLDIARRTLARIHKRQFTAHYWQPIP